MASGGVFMMASEIACTCAPRRLAANRFSKRRAVFRTHAGFDQPRSSS
jgi:hypothetical protein